MRDRTLPTKSRPWDGSAFSCQNSVTIRSPMAAQVLATTPKPQHRSRNIHQYSPSILTFPHRLYPSPTEQCELARVKSSLKSRVLAIAHKQESYSRLLALIPLVASRCCSRDRLHSSVTAKMVQVPKPIIN